LQTGPTLSDGTVSAWRAFHEEKNLIGSDLVNEPDQYGVTDDIFDTPTQSNVSEFSVSEISGKLKRLVEDAFGRVRVRGEIGRVSRPTSGHIYFDLKDDRAVLAAVTWKGAASKLAHMPEEGMEVVATGKLTTFPGSSKYQIIVEQIEPAGAGALMALLEKRKKKLEAEGLFAPERKQLLPFMPRIIGVVTSPSGAVVRDILHRISDRFPLHVLIWPVRVQGETTGKEVCAAIEGFNALGAGGLPPRPDVIIVARGGGSVEDLWGFNDEIVVRAAANSMIPLVSAVGHETDWTLLDLVADVRAPTPTGAAEMVVPVKAELEVQLASLNARLGSGIGRNHEIARNLLRSAARGLPTPDSLFAAQSQRFDHVAGGLARGLVSAIRIKQILFQKTASRFGRNLVASPVTQKRQALAFAERGLRSAQQSEIRLKQGLLDRTKPSSSQLSQVLTNAEQRFGFVSKGLDAANRVRMEKLNSRLGEVSRLLVSYSHGKTLERGFTLVRNSEGSIVSRASGTGEGEKYEVEFADGRVEMWTGRPEDGKVSSPRPQAGKSADKAKNEKSGVQKSLFD